MNKAKTIILGASHWHMPLCADRIAEQHDVVGVSDPDPSRTKHLADLWGAPLYQSWEEVLAAHGDAELAYVFVPHDVMREVCLALVARCIPLVVEKPAGVSLQELVDVRAAADAAGVPIAVPLVQRGGPTDRWLARAGRSVYESVQFIAGPPDRYLVNGSPWMVDVKRAGGGCMVNLAPHFVDLFLRSAGAEEVAVTAALSSMLHRRSVEDYASMTLTTADGRIATIEVGYAFPGSPLKRHCSFMRIGAAGTATIWSDGSASFTAVDGATTTARIDVDSDPLYGRFVDKVAEQLEYGFADLPGIRDLEATMTVIWDAYANGRQGRPVSTPSIDEVAAAAGVHRSTVSRAFSRPEAVKQETRDHVLQVAVSMGYTMSPLAQALRTKTSTLVPLIVPDIINPFFAELAKAMTAAARERGYQLVLCVTENDAGATAGYLRAMQSMYAPFAVLAPFASVDPDEFESFGFGRRLVVIDRVESNHQVPTVTVDSAKGIQLAFDHLLELGHTSIAYVSGIVGTHTAGDRRGAYRELAGLHRMAPIELNAGIGVEAGERAAEELVSMLQRPSAVIAANDMVAFGLISSLGSRGLSVPNDVSVVGFDGLVLGARSNPPLTSVQQPIAQMGRIAISLAERAAQNGHVEDVVLQPRLLVRSSTGPAR